MRNLCSLQVATLTALFLGAGACSAAADKGEPVPADTGAAGDDTQPPEDDSGVILPPEEDAGTDTAVDPPDTAPPAVEYEWVLAEGGPFHARGQLRNYVERLEATGRGDAIEELRRRHPREFA